MKWMAELKWFCFVLFYFVFLQRSLENRVPALFQSIARVRGEGELSCVGVTTIFP